MSRFLIPLVFLCWSCTQKEQASSFAEWNKSQIASEKDCDVEIQEMKISSSELQIQGLAPSMTGDMDQIETDVEGKGEVLWLMGCKVDLVDPATELNVSDEFLCHHIINYSRKAELPWKIPTQGTDKRLFTLSQGVNEIHFPKGFAIPFPEGEPLAVGNQVLNLQQPELNAKIRFDATIYYQEVEEGCEQPVALYEQPVFVTKKVAGPTGAFNESEGATHDSGFAQCGIRYADGFNPYLDPQGREFTGHWTISTDSVEVVRTNVTPMMDLRVPTTIHYIAVHIHPHAHSLELLDHTTGESLFKAWVKYHDLESFLVDEVDHYSSEKGIPVFPDHEYELVSTYLNPKGEEGITAMATMFLYMAER